MLCEEPPTPPGPLKSWNPPHPSVCTFPPVNAGAGCCAYMATALGLCRGPEPCCPARRARWGYLSILEVGPHFPVSTSLPHGLAAQALALAAAARGPGPEPDPGCSRSSPGLT